MPTKSQKNNTMPNQFHVGDRVGFRFGVSDVIGTVVEDRGRIGVGGRRLLRIEAPFSENTIVLELPEAELQAA